MDVPTIFDTVLTLFGVTVRAQATAAAKAEALIAINAAIQQMASAGEDFYGREEVLVALTPAQETYTLAKTVQSVLDPVYLSTDGSLLRKLASRGQLRQFGQLFLGQLTNTVSYGKPVAYFVESLKDTDGTSGAEDSVTVKLHILPAPSLTYSGANLVLNVIKEPTTIVVTDLTTGTAKIPVPHKYVESVLLPLIRWNATASYLFTLKDMIDRYAADKTIALQLLGQSDPRKASETETGALREPEPQRRAA